MKKILTLDLEKGWIRYAITTETLDILDHGKKEIENTKESEAVFSVIDELAEKYRNQVDGIALTLPGVIDYENGIAHSGGMYQWVHDTEYAKIVEERTGLKTLIVNDAKAAALAEAVYGSLRKAKRGVVLMLLGTGIGGAIIDHKRVINGAHFAAGEFSYIAGDYKDRDEGEDMFSSAVSINRLVEIVKEETGKENMNIMKTMRGVSVSDPDVLRGVRKYCRILAVFIYNIQAVIDAEQFSIGGNIIDEPKFVELIQEAVHERFEKASFHNIYEPVIRSVSFHEDSRKYGAVHLFMKVYGDNDEQ